MIECIFTIISLCGAIHDRPVVILGAVHATIASMDYSATLRGVGFAGYGESDPIVRPFIHHAGTVALLDAIEVAGYAMLAEHARRSPHRILRRTWWMWQGVPIALHVYGRSTWLREPKKCQGTYYQMGGVCDE